MVTVTFATTAVAPAGTPSLFIPTEFTINELPAPKVPLPLVLHWFDAIPCVVEAGLVSHIRVGDAAGINRSPLDVDAVGM